MLHIHNGDSSANIAKQSSLPGEHFAFREALIDGPAPTEFKVNSATWKLIRARHLWEAYDVDLKQAMQNLSEQEEKLASFPKHEEVILWFEHDLFCQIHLIYLLDWFERQHLGDAKLSLVCIGEFPGRENFRGLGELTPDEFASLFPARQPLTKAQLRLAASAWQAYCSTNPTDIEKLLQTDTSALPFLNAALRAHLERFPSTKNGLGRVENRALQLIDNGAEGFSDLFSKFAETELLYGLGDAQFWIALRRMMATAKPLVEVEGLGNEHVERHSLTPEIVSKAKFNLTEAGKAVLRNEADFVFLAHNDYWLGGVQLSGSRDVWRWDQTKQRVIVPEPR